MIGSLKFLTCFWDKLKNLTVDLKSFFNNGFKILINDLKKYFSSGII